MISIDWASLPTPLDQADAKHRTPRHDAALLRGRPRGSNAPTMDVRKATRDYITKMVSDVPGMKVFLLDNETVRCWSPPMAQAPEQRGS